MSAGVSAPQFVQCKNCKKTLFKKDFEASLHVCPYCGHHHRITAARRIDITFDPGTFFETDADLKSQDPLGFPEYREKVEAAEAKTGMRDAVVTGTAKIDGREVSTAVLDFYFMGGSMGSVGGEKIYRTLMRGAEERKPVVIFTASGGARMQEGILSLMQIAKTTAGVEACREAGVPYVAVFCDPTMAGILASYASVADVILAEPKAMVGFAGARVGKQAQVTKKADDFQSAEAFHRTGMIDKVVPRKELRPTLSTLIRTLGGHLVAGEKR